MVQVTQGLDKLNSTQTAQRLRDVAAAMKDNANFPAPNPTLEALLGAANAISAGETKVSGSEKQLSIDRADLRAASDNGKNLLSSEGTYVQGVADDAQRAGTGDAETIVKSANMDVKSAPTPAGSMPSPTEVKLTRGDRPGEVDAACHSVKGAVSYVWETCPGDDPINGAWSYAKTSTKSSGVTLEHLPSGGRVWVRVSAVGTKDTGPTSAPVDIRAD